jgi:hypothetical protein
MYITVPPRGVGCPLHPPPPPPCAQVMALRCACRSLRISIDAAVVPVITSDESDAVGSDSTAVSSVDTRPRATLSCLLQRCCSPRLVLHSHSYGPAKSFVPALSTPATLAGAALSGWGCGRGSMSIGQCVSVALLRSLAAIFACLPAAEQQGLTRACCAGSSHALYSSNGTCYGPLPPSPVVLLSSPDLTSPAPPPTPRQLSAHFLCTAIPLCLRSNDCGQIGSAPPSPPLLTPLPVPLPTACLQARRPRPFTPTKTLPLPVT